MESVTDTDAEEERFVEAISRARNHVIGVLRRLGAIAGDADDLTQEVFARAWRYRTSFDPSKPLDPWLSTIAARVWADHCAGASRRPASLGSEDRLVPDRSSRDVESRDRIMHALATLTPIQRAVLLSFHRDGASIAEIARETNMPVNTVKSHLHRARQALGEGGS
jgi:RNA polymerase sigma-70 factor (ECF subfamily)